MKMTGKNRFLSFLLCSVLIAASALTAGGCGKAIAPLPEFPKVENPSSEVTQPAASAAVEIPAEEDSAEEVPAEHHFTFKVVDAEGNEKTFDIVTTETNVGEALLKEGLIAGDSGPYGIYVKQVNGITADYDTDGTYWAFYIDGEMAMTGVDATDITDGAEYMFKVES